MLSACVSGEIFASPSASQILTCIQLAATVQSTHDVLMVVNNYTGDRLNFGLAAERARAVGINVETVVVADDVALLDRPSLVGARGLAGNILMCKMLGAAAESGLSLAQLKVLGDALVANLASIGLSLEHCHVPGRTIESDAQSDKLSFNECELGMGLHNEPGVRKMKMGSPEQLIGVMLEQILTSKERRAEDTTIQRSESMRFVETGNDNADLVVLYVNNLGGMSILEMGAIIDEAVNQLGQYFRPSVNSDAYIYLNTMQLAQISTPHEFYFHLT